MFTALSVECSWEVAFGLIWFLSLANGPSALGPEGDSHPEICLKACSSPTCGEVGYVGVLVLAWELWVFWKLQGSLCFCLQFELGSCSLCVHPTLRALVGSEWVGKDTPAAVDASSFLFEGSDAAADEGYFIY